MESIHHIKARIKTVKNVGQITKAMELVAATKMRKAQEIAMRSRPYAYGALELLRNVTASTSLVTPLTQERAVQKTLVIMVASDKGLTGSFNTQVFKAADIFFKNDQTTQRADHVYMMLPIGKKSLYYAVKNKVNIAKHFSGVGDYITPEECMPIGELAMKGYLEHAWDRVVIISTHFRTTLKQEVLVRQLLPMSVPEIRKAIDEIIPEHGRFASSGNFAANKTHNKPIEYIFEPSPAAVLEALLPHLLAMQLYHAILEANASEHSARRVAMKTASDNADELSGGLTLLYNKARQASITTELIEITSTQQAL